MASWDSSKNLIDYGSVDTNVTSIDKSTITCWCRIPGFPVYCNFPGKLLYFVSNNPNGGGKISNGIITSADASINVSGSTSPSTNFVSSTPSVDIPLPTISNRTQEKYLFAQYVANIYNGSTKAYGHLMKWTILKQQSGSVEFYTASASGSTINWTVKKSFSLGETITAPTSISQYTTSSGKYTFTGKWASSQGSSTQTTVKTGKVEDGDNLKYYAIYQKATPPKLNINFTGNCGTHACMDITLYISKTPTSVENNYSFKKPYTITKSPFTDTIELNLDAGNWYVILMTNNIQVSVSSISSSAQVYCDVLRVTLDSSEKSSPISGTSAYGPFSLSSSAANHTLNIPYSIKVSDNGTNIPVEGGGEWDSNSSSGSTISGTVVGTYGTKQIINGNQTSYTEVFFTNNTNVTVYIYMHHAYNSGNYNRIATLEKGKTSTSGVGGPNSFWWTAEYQGEQPSSLSSKSTLIRLEQR